MERDHSGPDLTKWPSEQMRIFAYIGVCLAVVQAAERALQNAVETVLDSPDARLIEQSEPLRKQTLGDFLKKLKRRVKLPPHIRERLYEFLKMRNQLVHGFSEIPGWNLSTDDGRRIAERFLVELTSAAISITGLCTAIFQVWARDQHEDFYGEKYFEMQSQEGRQIIKLFQQQFGNLARELLAARVGKKARARPSS